VFFFIEFTSPYSLDSQRGWHNLEVYDISFKYPYKLSGRWQVAHDLAIDQAAYMDT